MNLKNISGYFVIFYKVYLFFSLISLENYSLIVFSDVSNQTDVAFTKLKAKGNVLHRSLLFGKFVDMLFCFQVTRTINQFIFEWSVKHRTVFALEVCDPSCTINIFKNGYGTIVLRVVLFPLTIMDNFQSDLVRSPMMHANSIYISDHNVFHGWGRSSKK